MRDILESYPVSELKKEVSKYNHKVKIAGYSKLKKADLIKEMLKHKEAFKHMTKRTKAAPAPKPKKAAPAKKEAPKAEKAAPVMTMNEFIKKYKNKFDKVLKKHMEGADKMLSKIESTKGITYKGYMNKVLSFGYLGFQNLSRFILKNFGVNVKDIVGDGYELLDPKNIKALSAHTRPLIKMIKNTPTYKKYMEKHEKLMKTNIFYKHREEA